MVARVVNELSVIAGANVTPEISTGVRNSNDEGLRPDALITLLCCFGPKRRSLLDWLWDTTPACRET